MSEPKPKRKYVRRPTQAGDKPLVMPRDKSKGQGDASLPPCDQPDGDAMLAAERLFDDHYLLGYHTINAFLRLFRMVHPEDHSELVSILEGLVCNPRQISKK